MLCKHTQKISLSRESQQNIPVTTGDRTFTGAGWKIDL